MQTEELEIAVNVMSQRHRNDKVGVWDNMRLWDSVDGASPIHDASRVLRRGMGSQLLRDLKLGDDDANM